MDNPMHYSEDTTMRQDDCVTSVTFTLPAGHKWTSVEAAMKEAHDREYELRMAFFWECQRLQAEVKFLSEAKDAMDEVEKCFDGKTPILEGMESVRKIVKSWIKAKEDKPTK